MKAHYFLWNAGNSSKLSNIKHSLCNPFVLYSGTAPVTPFLTVYAKQLGFSSFIVGIIYTILPICGMIARPMFGAVADRYKCQKRIFLMNQLLTAVMFLAILYIPETTTVSRAHFACHSSESVFDVCWNNRTHRHADRNLFQLEQLEDAHLIGDTTNCEVRIARIAVLTGKVHF